MLCRKTSVKNGRGSVAVYLNVYDLTSVNGYAYWLGLGAYHSGVQVHGVEYAFGAHEFPSTGIFEGQPKQCEGFTFRKSILIGWTEMTRGGVKGLMDKLAEKYRGDAYNLITKNCNHFCNDACIQLTGNPIPRWVNRLARIGFYFKCIIPVKLNSTKVGIQKLEDKACETDKSELQTCSNTSNNSSSCTTTTCSNTSNNSSSCTTTTCSNTSNNSSSCTTTIIAYQIVMPASSGLQIL